MNEIDYLKQLDEELSSVWEKALSARDEAQQAMEHITMLKSQMTKRQIELQKARLAELSK